MCFAKGEMTDAPFGFHPENDRPKGGETGWEGGIKMRICLQLALFCALYFFMVKLAARDNGLNCLYFYPNDYIEKAVALGLADREETRKKGKRFMITFCVILLVVLIWIIARWNRVTDFQTAYWQACLFLVVVNWFDGLVIDVLWVGHSRIWVIPEMKGYPYRKPLRSVLVRRSVATAAYLLLAVLPAGMVVLLGRL
jgi:magnesium-transporting ATPase (P-type)